jgi:hypothetical protein
VSLTVGQGTRVGAYRLTLPVEAVDASGTRRTMRVTVEARSSQTIVLPGTFAAAPATVRCAGDHTLLAVCTPE